MRFTELEKTMLLMLLVFIKGSFDIYVEEKKITSKFSMRKRKFVRTSLDRLKKEGLLIKHPREKKYKFSKKGLEAASNMLHEGAKLWGMG